MHRCPACGELFNGGHYCPPLDTLVLDGTGLKQVLETADIRFNLRDDICVALLSGDRKAPSECPSCSAPLREISQTFRVCDSCRFGVFHSSELACERTDRLSTGAIEPGIYQFFWSRYGLNKAQLRKFREGGRYLLVAATSHYWFTRMSLACDAARAANAVHRGLNKRMHLEREVREMTKKDFWDYTWVAGRLMAAFACADSGVKEKNIIVPFEVMMSPGIPISLDDFSLIDTDEKLDQWAIALSFVDLMEAASFWSRESGTGVMAVFVYSMHTAMQNWIQKELQKLTGDLRWFTEGLVYTSCLPVFIHGYYEGFKDRLKGIGQANTRVLAALVGKRVFLQYLISKHRESYQGAVQNGNMPSVIEHSRQLIQYPASVPEGFSPKDIELFFEKMDEAVGVYREEEMSAQMKKI